MTTPITPDDLDTAYVLPEWVVEVWNRLITEAWSNRSAVVYATRAQSELHAVARKIAVIGFDPRWLDIFATYEAAGWTVTYTNDPGCYTFKRKPVKRGASDE